MSRDDEIVRLLTEIRDQQRHAIARQQESIDLQRSEAERLRGVSDQALGMQRVAVRFTRLGFPFILLVIAMMIYLLYRIW